MSKEHPIIFSSEMIRAILDNRKSQTRRVIKPQPEQTNVAAGYKVTVRDYCTGMPEAGLAYYWQADGCRNSTKPLVCPYGKVGDRLWVREGYRIRQSCCNVDLARENVLGFYLADDIHFSRTLTNKESELFNKRKKPFARTPGQFMYKSLARIWLEVTGIRVERVREIDENDACEEGCELYTAETNLDCVRTFARLWDSLNAKRKGSAHRERKARAAGEYSWEKNPWVWVISFKRIKAK